MANWTPKFDVALSKMNFGEQRVARQLEELLPKTAHIIAGYRWQVIKADRATKNLETDFVVFWPHRGVVVLEVKSGAVDWDPLLGSWIGLISRSPTEQARGSMNDLVDRLALHSGQTEPSTVWRQRVQAFPLFPDVERDRFPSSMDGFDRDCILGRNELKNIGEVLERHTKRTAERCAELSSDRCASLIKLLCPSVHLHPRASHIIEDESKAIEWATDRGLRIVAALRGFHRVFVCGSAGTGKTILGLSAMKTWIEAGENAIFVSRNPHLAQFLRSQFPKQASHIYSLATFLTKVAGLELPPDDPLPEETLMDALLRPAKTERLAALSMVLDEAQDFSRDSLEALLSFTNYARLWVLYDDQQVLQKGERVEDFESRVGSAAGHSIERIRLPWNLRNTQKIGEYVSEWVRTAYAPFEGLPVGEPPSITHVRDEVAHDNALEKLLVQLFIEEKYSAEDVVLLSCLPTAAIKRKYASPEGAKRLGRTIRYLGESTARGELRVASILDFKGQEASAVVLVDTRDASALNAFYIGGSRAKVRLFVLAFEKDVERPSANINKAAQQAGFRI